MDDRDWTGFHALLTETITLDLGPFGHNGPMLARDFVAGNSSLLDPTEFTQHNVGNEIVDIDGDTASVKYYEMAVLRHSPLSDDPAVNSWTFCARGELGLQRTSDGWKVSSNKVRRIHITGNENLRSDIASM